MHKQGEDVPKCLFYATIPQMKVALFCHRLERDWLEFLPAKNWSMQPIQEIPAGRMTAKATVDVEQLYRVTYQLRPLGAGEGAVYVLQQNTDLAYVRIDELTSLDRLFFAPMMVKWLKSTFGVVAYLDRQHTNAREVLTVDIMAGQTWVVSAAGHQHPWSTDDQYLALLPHEQTRYDRLRQYQEAWETGKITNSDLAGLLGVSSDTVRRWRREFHNRGLPNMKWTK